MICDECGQSLPPANEWDTVWIKDRDGAIREVIWGGFVTNRWPGELWFATKEECEAYYVAKP